MNKKPSMGKLVVDESTMVVQSIGTDKYCNAPHCMVLVGNKLIVGIRGAGISGGYIARFNNLNDLKDYAVFKLSGAFPNNYPQVDAAVYNSSTGKVYMLAMGMLRSKMIEVDPSAAIWSETTACKTIYSGFEDGSEQTMAIDEKNQWLFTAGALGRLIHRFDLRSISAGGQLNTPKVIDLRDQGATSVALHSMAISDGKLFVLDGHNFVGNSWVVKIDVENFALEKCVNMPAGQGGFTDDCAIAKKQLFAGVEKGYEESNGLIIQYETDTLKYRAIYTDMDVKIDGGIFYDGEYLWVSAGYTNPSALVRMDPKSLEIKTHFFTSYKYRLNEMVFAKGKIFATAFTLGSGDLIPAQLVGISMPKSG